MEERMIRPMQSDEINELAAALAAAQAHFPVILKLEKAEIRSVKGDRSYRYADLGAVLDGIRAHLSIAGLAYTQPLLEDEGGLVLRTMLIHSSGQWLASELRIPTQDLIGPQALGSYLAYARRYSIQGLTGIPIQDDDGAAAQIQAQAAQRQSRSDYRDHRNGILTTPDPKVLAERQASPVAIPSGLSEDEALDRVAARHEKQWDDRREPGDDDEPAETSSTERDGRWLAPRVAKRGLNEWFDAYGMKRGFPHRLDQWSKRMVVEAIAARKEAVK